MYRCGAARNRQYFKSGILSRISTKVECIVSLDSPLFPRLHVLFQLSLEYFNVLGGDFLALLNLGQH